MQKGKILLLRFVFSIFPGLKTVGVSLSCTFSQSITAEKSVSNTLAFRRSSISFAQES